MKPTLGIVGAGKVGQTLARLLYARGYPIAAVYSLHHAQPLAQQTESRVTLSPAEVLHIADLTLLTVPDDVIETVAVDLASGDFTGKAVVHTSGVYDSDVLAALSDAGAMTGSLHPAFPFAEVDAAVQSLPGATFAVESESALLMDWLVNIIRALDGRILKIPPGRKAQYHAALVIASNYTVTLYAAAQRLLLELDDDRVAVDGALNALVGATTANLRDAGVPDALTGPLVRGDAGTVTAHLEALQAVDASLAELYRQLAWLTFPLLHARGVATEALETVLRQGADHETDHT